MQEAELKKYLLSCFPRENEKCDWKEFKSLKHSILSHEGNDIVSYVSAISNMKGGHLVVGVADLTLEIIGIQDFHVYNDQSIILKLLKECLNLNEDGLEVEEFTTNDTNKTVWVIHIPRHLYRLPVYAHKKAWQRVGDSLVEMTSSRLDAIINEVRISEDWTAAVIPDATISDLDEMAIVKARDEFKKRVPKYAIEVDSWNNTKFLDKAKLTIKGRITRTALLLLGKEEAEHYLGSFVKIRWNLKTVENQDKDFEIFSIPFILNVDNVYNKIRNLKYRYLRPGTLFPDEVLRYDPFTIRELLNNAIAHQDYVKKARINVVEFEDDHLVFSNYGAFLPKSINDVVLRDTPEEVYRNPFLVEAMKNLDMIETQGGGIRKVFNLQRLRFFPMPDYDLSDGKVKVTITGKVLSEDFANILIQNPALTLENIILLDKVQKKDALTDDDLKLLRRLGFVEGRKPAIYLSFKLVESVNDEILKREYIANRSFDDDHFKRMIVQYLTKFGATKRNAIDGLIIPKLSIALTEIQKKAKVTNLLSALRMENRIKVSAYGTWELV
ncbi:MAG: putative DNA binding domain-containing protein [Candidatus Pseudobacter hemicellulosilyticus]|uniref:DNA binding domain-containing protein n=1 Tax=Candidatus Pseudobacter hemicellulosilyticus TaxID=3121375 RepID=A0AAJ6BGC9_9BACT|nr:MAG: putative DNA binding domain-containing protein [Pseudobacter sp.]